MTARQASVICCVFFLPVVAMALLIGHTLATPFVYNTDKPRFGYVIVGDALQTVLPISYNEDIAPGGMVRWGWSTASDSHYAYECSGIPGSTDC